MNFPHDGFYKENMKDKKIAKEMMRMHLPPHLQKKIDFKSMKLMDGHYVTAEMKQYESDIVYSIDLTTGPGYIYVLCEHQSKADKDMPIRLMEYSLCLMRDHLKQGNKKLPLVIPMVIYNGKKAYQFPTTISEYFEDPELAEQYFFKWFYLVDLSEIPDEELHNHTEAKMMALALKHTSWNDFKSIQRLIRTGVIKEFTERGDTYRITVLIQYLYRITSADNYQKLTKLLKDELTKQGDVMFSIWDKAIKEGLEEGLEQGLEKGLERGKQEGIELGKQEMQRQCAKALMEKGMTDAQIKEAINIPAKILKALKAELKSREGK